MLFRSLLWWARAYAFPRSVVAYRTIGYDWLKPGMLVWLVDAELSIEQAAWVQAIQINEAGYQVVELVLWRNPGAQ